VREFSEALLTARGEWTDAVERYVKSRSVDVNEGTEVPQ
jgi:3-deoxy-D-manno-octulosonate 8-phosphate phosphatase (KDO 8-P phosphatase)